MISKVKILFILHLPPPIHGASIVGEYIKNSNQINSVFECKYINLTIAQCLEDVGKGGIRKLKLFKRKLNEIKDSIKDFNPDWIYITPNSAGGAFYKDYVIVQKCKKWGNGNIILHFHNKGVKTREKRLFDNYLYKRFFNKTKVILLGKSLYEDINKYVQIENVRFCPNGIPEVKCESQKEKKQHNEVPHILWLSNIMLSKGLLEYLKALHLLKKRGLLFVADFVGGITSQISERQFNDYIREYDLEDCVIYHGKKYGDDKAVFFKNASVFVLPSYTEAFPLTILEAMQYNLPILATNVGGVSDAVTAGVNGILIGGSEPIMTNDYRPNPYEIEKALEKILDDEDLRQGMGKNSRKKYVEEFTLGKFEYNFVSALKSFINK